jgi:hypothetical protein
VIENIFKTILKALWDLIKFIFSLIFNKSGVKSGPRGISRQTIELITNEWALINIDLKSKSPSVLKTALIRADKSLDNLLKEISKGNTMGEKMIASKSLFSDITYQKIWAGHKVRNSMVHDSGYEPQTFILIEAIENLRAGVSELGVKS